MQIQLNNYYKIFSQIGFIHHFGYSPYYHKVQGFHFCLPLLSRTKQKKQLASLRYNPQRYTSDNTEV